MYQKIVENYLSSLTLEDVMNFAHGYQYPLEEKEAKIIYNALKKDYQKLLEGDYQACFETLKKELSPTTYTAVTNLYFDAKKKYHF